MGIEIEDLREAGEDGGDLMGYFARGHFGGWEFADACNKRSSADAGYDRRYVRADDVRQTWWRTTPMSGQPGCYVFNVAEPKSKGAFPVTVWDGLAAINSEQSKRVIREFHRGRCNGISEGVNWSLQYVERVHGRKACEAMLTSFRANRERVEGSAL